MKKIVTIVTSLVIVSTLAIGQTTERIAGPQSGATSILKPPKGWLLQGSHPQNYDMGADLTVRRSGGASGHIRSKATATAAGFGTIGQSVKADKYRDKRIRLSGYVKADGVEDQAGLWMRVDGQQDEMLGFDNMENRPIKGNADWKKYEIVLEVPRNSRNISFGFLLVGKGRIWVDDLQLNPVGQNMLSTNLPPQPLTAEQKREQEEYERTHKDEIERKKQDFRRRLKTTTPLRPVNLDFEGR